MILKAPLWQEIPSNKKLEINFNTESVPPIPPVRCLSASQKSILFIPNPRDSRVGWIKCRLFHLGTESQAQKHNVRWMESGTCMQHKAKRCHYLFNSPGYWFSRPAQRVVPRRPLAPDQSEWRAAASLVSRNIVVGAWLVMWTMALAWNCRVSCNVEWIWWAPKNVTEWNGC